jgi:hypothetical protein
MDHTPEDVGSKPTTGNISNLVVLQKRLHTRATTYTRTPLNPLSSAAERRTHNPEVGGSKPPGGIYTLSALKKPMVIC